MPQRFLRPGITTSDSWNSCGFEAQSLFVRLLTVCDDYGRYDGRGAVVHGHCFALRQDVTIERTRELIEELSENSLVETYEVGGKQFLRITRWQERARGVSKYPSPPNELPTGEAIGSIYFVRAGKGDRIKIGYTQFTPEERLRRLQVGSSEKLVLVAVISGTLREERALHRQFSADNVGGEWFKLSDDLKGFIASRSKSTHSAGKLRIPQAEDASLAIVPSPSSLAITSSPLRPDTQPEPASPELLRRAGKLFCRRDTTPFGVSELKAWANARKVVEEATEEDWAVLEWTYRQRNGETAQYRKQDLATLLNQWSIQVDRSKKWKRTADKV